MVTAKGKSDVFVDVEAGESTALLNKKGTEKKGVEDTNSDDASDDSNSPKIRQIVVNCASLAAFGTSVASIFTMKNPLVYVGNGIGAAMAPVAAMQERKLTELGTLKELNDELGKEIMSLDEQNSRLEKQANELNDSVNRMEGVEEVFESLKEKEVNSLSALESQLARSKAILEKVEDSLRFEVNQNIISIILEADLDKDFEIDDDKIDNILQRLNQYEIIKVDSERLKQLMINSGRDIKTIKDSIENMLMSDDIPEEELIIQILGL